MVVFEDGITALSSYLFEYMNNIETVTLTEEEKCVNDIATAMNMSLSAVSHQLRILKQAHLVRYRRVGKNALYSLSDDHVRTILKQGLEHVRE